MAQSQAFQSEDHWSFKLYRSYDQFELSFFSSAAAQKKRNRRCNLKIRLVNKVLVIRAMIAMLSSMSSGSTRGLHL
jgi:hypothetical protein